MIGFLRRIYKKRTSLAHLKKLKELCVMGDDFCKSPFYSDSMLQLLNVKVKNLTGDNKKINFGSKCNVSVNIFLNRKGSINIGNYVYINQGCSLRIDHNLTIGSNCMFGPNVTIWDTDNHPLSAKMRFEQTIEIPNITALDSYESSGGDINIGDNVWIGMDALVLGGVTIGNGSIVSARSVVTNDIPPMTIVAGVPARKIGDVPN